jgi:DNA-directed RNA polymerase I, II, and III subunit RPABC2
MSEEKYESDVSVDSDEDDETYEPTSLPKALRKPDEVDQDKSDSEVESEMDSEDEDLEEKDDDMEDEPTENPIAGRNMNRPADFADFNSEDDDDASQDDDEPYLQKFDESLQKKIISDYHPELQIHNYEEVETLSRIFRDVHGNIIDPLHKTLPFITRYEKARILGERAKQLNSGASPFVEVDPSIIDGYLIALKEYEEKKIPFIVKRPLPNGGCEYWRFQDLEIIS